MSNVAVTAPAQNPWDEAYDLLDPDLKASLGGVRNPKVDVLQRVLDVAEDKKKACLAHPWKFKKPGGGEIIIRDVLEKIIVWVDRFKAVGDTAVQYDPVHAALPWAGVRFLLQAVVNGVEIFGTLVESLELVSGLISRCAIAERIYLPYATSAVPGLRKALTRLYTEVLKHLAKAIRYLRAARWSKSTPPALSFDPANLTTQNNISRPHSSPQRSFKSITSSHWRTPLKSTLE